MGEAAQRVRRSPAAGLAVAALTAAALVAPAGSVHASSPITPTVAAEPKPDPQEIKRLEAEAERLNSQLERLTENYNGLRVRLSQAKRATQSARDNAKRQNEALDSIRQRVGEHAANSYMHGGRVNPLALISSSDPQTALDQSATLHYFTQQDDVEIRTLVQAIQSAERARQSAEARASEVTRLSGQVTTQKKQIEKTLEKVRGKLLKYGIKDKGEKVPTIPGASGKALGAVKAALTQLGKPYVWGADGPTSFDCSGLTMWAYKQVGVNLPHYGGDQWRAGVHVPEDKLRPGDLVFFYNDIHHMGMYIGSKKFVHAPRTGDVVKIEKMSTRPFKGAVRIV